MLHWQQGYVLLWKKNHKRTNPSHKLVTVTILPQPMAPGEENTDLVMANSSAIQTHQHLHQHTVGRQVAMRANHHLSIHNPSVGALGRGPCGSRNQGMKLDAQVTAIFCFI